MLVDVPDKKLLTIGKRYFKSTVEGGQVVDVDSSSDTKLKSEAAASTKGQPFMLHYDQ